MRQITVPAGIGDNVWLIQKLINQREKIHFVLPGQNPQRGKQIFDLCPQLVNTAVYSRDRKITYKYLSEKNIARTHNRWDKIKYSHFFLSCNDHLEQGNRLDDFLLDLPISYTIDWNTKHFAPEVESEFKTFEFKIGIYGSSYSTSRAWGFWQENEWLELILKIHAINPKITFIIIGAEWDLDLGVKLINRLKANNISCFDTVGKPLAYVVEVMKRLDYAFYFPSGLPILSETLTQKTACTMFYPSHLKRMIGTWRNPDRGILFNETLFCSPDEIFNFVKNDYQLFERL